MIRHSLDTIGMSYAYTEDGDREIEWRLKWRWVPYRAETRWEPAEGGYAEPIAWLRDGAEVDEDDVPERIRAELHEKAAERYSEMQDIDYA